MEKTNLKTPEKTGNVQASQTPALGSNEGCVSAGEFGVSVSRKVMIDGVESKN